MRCLCSAQARVLASASAASLTALPSFTQHDAKSYVRHSSFLYNMLLQGPALKFWSSLSSNESNLPCDPRSHRSAQAPKQAILITSAFAPWQGSGTPDEMQQILDDPECLKDEFTIEFISEFPSVRELQSLECQISLLLISSVLRWDNIRVECRFAFIRRLVLTKNLTHPYDFARCSADFCLAMLRNLQQVMESFGTPSCGSGHVNSNIRPEKQLTRKVYRDGGAHRVFMSDFLKEHRRESSSRSLEEDRILFSEASAEYRNILREGGQRLRDLQSRANVKKMSIAAQRRLYGKKLREPGSRPPTRRLRKRGQASLSNLGCRSTCTSIVPFQASDGVLVVAAQDREKKRLASLSEEIAELQASKKRRVEEAELERFAIKKFSHDNSVDLHADVGLGRGVNAKAIPHTIPPKLLTNLASLESSGHRHSLRCLRFAPPTTKMLKRIFADKRRSDQPGSLRERLHDLWTRKHAQSLGQLQSFVA